MAKPASVPLKVRLRLIHDGTQPGPALAEPMQFGLQDSSGGVHPGTDAAGGVSNFDFTLDVRPDAAGAPVFSGAFAHGPAQARFVYLSWKRVGVHEHPWCWRIKMPLAGLSWPEIEAAAQPGRCLTADVTGRRPHSSQKLVWTIAPTDDPLLASDR